MSALSSIVLSSLPWPSSRPRTVAFKRNRNVDPQCVPTPRERTVPECTLDERNARRLAYLLKYPEDDHMRELESLKSAASRAAQDGAR